MEKTYELYSPKVVPMLVRMFCNSNNYLPVLVNSH